MKAPLDHVGFLGPAIDALVQDFTALGFRILGPAPLEAVDADGRARPLGQSSAHIMFEDSYIELTAVTRAGPDHHLAPWLAKPPGIRLLLLQTDQARDTAARLAASGVPVTAVAGATRRLTYGNRGPVAFSWFALEGSPLPGTLAAFVQHHDRAAVFAPEVRTHPNTVTGITALYHRPRPLPAWLAGPAGVELIEDRHAAPGKPFLTGLGLAATDLDRCQAVMAANGVAVEREDDTLRVAAEQAGGAWLRIGAEPGAAR